jgi:hypothetical protein
MHNPSIGFTLIFTLCHNCAFTCMSWMETSCIMVLAYKNTLFTPTMDYNGIMAMLSKIGYQ